MSDHANKINAVINTLQAMTIPSTEDNLTKMLGCLQVLTEVKEALEGESNEHADAE